MKILNNYFKYLNEATDATITFPKDEWDDVKKRLNLNEVITSVRNSCGKNKKVFKVGDKYKTQWGDTIEIVKVKSFKDPKKIPTWNEMNKTMQASIMYGIKMCGTDNLQWVHIKKSIDTINYVYHVVKDKKLRLLKKHGLSSPRRLYDIDRKLFNDTSFRIYKGRTSLYKNKDIEDVTHEDVIDYLDNSPQRIPELSSKSLFFSFLPIHEHHPNFRKRLSSFIELKLPIDYLMKQTNKPVIVGPGKPTRFSTWNEIQSPKFIKTVIDGANKIPSTKLLFKFVPHLAVDLNHIPYNKFSIGAKS